MARTPYLLLVLILLGGCSSKPHVVVGSKNFTEQVVLAEIIAQQIERSTSIEVERKVDLGGTLLAHEALKSGSIDLYPEYTGTALTAVLKQPINKDPQAVFSAVQQGYQQWRLSWLSSLGFNNTFAMVSLSSLAKQERLTRLTDAATRSKPWRMGVGYEFVERPDGLEGLKKAYGLKLDGEPVTMDLGLLYSALHAGTIEMGAGAQTDAALTTPEFVVLDDDKHFFPPYQCSIVVRDETLARFPQLKASLDTLSGTISNTKMRQLNASVDRSHRTVADVAHDFLLNINKP